MTDDGFDVAYEEPWRSRAARYWSPLAVAKLAARWLTETGITTVMDVGAGAGKFCVVGALTTEAHFVGVEHRRALVTAARRAAVHWGVDRRVHFVHAEINVGLLADFQALYLFNPFAENLYAARDRLDASVELNLDRFRRDIVVVDFDGGRELIHSRRVREAGSPQGARRDIDPPARGADKGEAGQLFFLDVRSRGLALRAAARSLATCCR